MKPIIIIKLAIIKIAHIHICINMYGDSARFSSNYCRFWRLTCLCILLITINSSDQLPLNTISIFDKICTITQLYVLHLHLISLAHESHTELHSIAYLHMNSKHKGTGCIFVFLSLPHERESLGIFSRQNHRRRLLTFLSRSPDNHQIITLSRTLDL